LSSLNIETNGIGLKKNGEKMKRLLFLLSLLLILPLFGFQFSGKFLYAQSKENDSKLSQKKIQFVRKMVKGDGWELPLDKKFYPRISTQYNTFNGIPLKIEERDFEDRFVMKFNTYHIAEEGTLYTYTTPCAPTVIASLKVQNTEKIFGYALTCTFVKLDEEGFIKDRYLKAFRFFYYDENEDGIFETRYYAFNIPDVPEWVKNLNKGK
jgi:hypothetical protein